MKNWLLILVGCILLIYPVRAMPDLLHRKQEKGSFFEADPRIFVAKAENSGNNLNMENKLAFFFATLVSLVLIGAGVYSLLFK